MMIIENEKCLIVRLTLITLVVFIGGVCVGLII
jgi:hypothetical protein